jgi:hypothetical protein
MSQRKESIKLIPTPEPTPKPKRMKGMRVKAMPLSNVSQNTPLVRPKLVGEGVPDTPQSRQDASKPILTQADIDRLGPGEKRIWRGLGLIPVWRRKVD